MFLMTVFVCLLLTLSSSLTNVKYRSTHVLLKVKCCAIEIAEAVQTLSFHQKSMQAAESIAASKKVSLDDMRKSLTRLAEEMEVQLVLKMDQIEVPLRGDPSDYANAVPVTREEILRVNDCIVESGRRKLAAIQKSMRLRKVVSRHEWQHTCEKMMLDDLQQDLRDIREFKVHSREFISSRCKRVIMKIRYEYHCDVPSRRFKIMLL